MTLAEAQTAVIKTFIRTRNIIINIIEHKVIVVGSLAKGLECCFYDGHDRKVDGSTPTQT